MNIVRPCLLCTCTTNMPMNSPPICQRCARELSLLDPASRMNVSLKIAELHQKAEILVSVRVFETAFLAALERGMASLRQNDQN